MLFRINAQSEVYEQALADAGVPYVVRGGERFFAPARDPPGDERASAWRAAAAPTRTPLRRRRARRAGARSASPPDPPGGAAARAQWESLIALVELAEELAGASRTPTCRRFVAELETRADAQHAPTVEGVTLASLHAAKGLEWDAVFLVGLADGTLPIQHADDAESDRGGAPAALRRHHPGPAAGAAVLGAGPAAGRARSAAAQPVPHGTRAGAPPGVARSPLGEAARAKPRCRVCGAARRRRRAEAAALRRLPVRRRYRAGRGAAGVAQGRAARAAGSRLRRVHRRHADRDRRAAGPPIGPRSSPSRDRRRSSTATGRRAGDRGEHGGD